MATAETKALDSIIASRRSVLLGAGALAATAVLGGEKQASASVPATLTDSAILNFALNLEYLEAQFYTLATEGVTADKSTRGNAITVGSGAGTVSYPANVTATNGVPFASIGIQAYALEIAKEERNHVTFIQGALGSGSYVSQPNLNLNTSFVTVGSLANVSNFNPFVNDLTFLYGSYIFEDVGVTAYHGGALAISKANLTSAAGIHAVEAYHAGMVRTLLSNIDQGTITIPGITVQQGSVVTTANNISNARAMLDGTAGTLPTDAPGLTGQDDFGISPLTVPLNGVGGPYQASNVLDEGKLTAANASTYTYSNYVAFGRTPQQVLDIVYGSKTGAQGGFFPNGLNALSGGIS